MVWAGGGPAIPEGVDPPYLRALKGEMSFMKSNFFKNYQSNFIKTSSFKPIIHVMVMVTSIGYVMDYAFHLRHERHSAQRKRLQAGGHGGHH